jgi:membrane protein YqaA with SNARE-associated domain
MRLFQPLYESALRWAAQPRAEVYLVGLSLIEAFIFPLAPEIMLAPMTLAKPHRWARYATQSLLGSLIGSLIGYALGHFAFDWARPLFARIGWLGKLDELVGQLRTSLDVDPWRAFWMLVFAGFLPIPLKIFTWASGIVSVPLPAFIAGMLIGRGKRVFAVSGAIRLGGERVERALHRSIEWLGWGLLVVVTSLILYFRFWH